MFERPGDRTFATDWILPPSDHYIIHPALDARVRTLSPSYGRSFDTLNIAGAFRPWRDESNRKGVVIGDIVGYSNIMKDPELAREFPGEFEKIVTSSCMKLDSKSIEGGDSFTLVDRNIANLMESIHSIAGALNRSIFGAQIRVGADFGLVVNDGNGEKYANRFVGMPLRTASRLEVLAEPDKLVMTSEFIEAMRKFNDNFECVSATELGSLSEVPRDDGKFNIKKKGQNDADIWRTLFYCDLLN